MKVRTILFRIWIGLTGFWLLLSFVAQFEFVAMKFRLGANHPWIYLGIAVLLGGGIPLLILAVGRLAFWITDRIRTPAPSN
jgi:hypothetical protein